MSSSLDYRHEFRELIHGVDESRQRYSNATREVSWLERCLGAVKVALEASKGKITAMQVAAADAQGHIMGEGAFSSYRPVSCLPFLILLFACHQRWRSS